MEKEKVKENDKIGFFKKTLLKMKKRLFNNKSRTLILSVILVVVFVLLNILAKSLDIPDIDVTENKIYTLSKASKDALNSITQDTKIYVYGFTEDSPLVDFLKQYNKANPKITYEIITEENNLQMVQENDLSEGYMVLIIESGNSRKVIDAQNEFFTYDYTTYEQIDTTEQCITNAILALNEENKPNVYFLQGHGEFSSSELVTINAYLQNEAYQSQEISLVNSQAVPEDCDLLVMLSPETDLYDPEVQMIQDYINKGGNVFFTQDMLSQNITFPNIQKILDNYGVSVQNGFIIESDANYAVQDHEYIFRPHISSSHKITEDIYTDGYMLLVYASRINSKTDEELSAMNVTKEELLYSGDDAYFIKDTSFDDVTDAKEIAEQGKQTIACLMTKNISGAEETGDLVQSKLVIAAAGSFMSDYSINTTVTGNVPLSLVADNKDFVLNSIAYLTERNGTLAIRKDMASATYVPTVVQNNIVLLTVFGVPVLVIAIGIFIWNLRKKRK